MKKLKEFLEQHNACKDCYEFAKDLTLEQFVNTCERGDWILWLFARMNEDSLRELTLAKGHCANTVRHLMKDERSTKAVDVAIAFGEGRATIEELKETESGSYLAAYYAVNWLSAWCSRHSARAAASAARARAAAAEAAAAERKANQKLTADICRKYLPLEIWDQSKL